MGVVGISLATVIEIVSPDSYDPAGKSSRLTSADGGLIEALDLGKAELVVRIDDKQFRGAIAPELGHASHTE